MNNDTTPQLKDLWGAFPNDCKHEQVDPPAPGQHENVGGNCAVCKMVFAKSQVEIVDGVLRYKPFVYVPAGGRRRR